MAKADEIQQTLLPTTTGKKVFPSASNTAAKLHSVSKLAENVQTNLNTNLGPKSKHRQRLAIRVTEGLPPAFCSVLGYSQSYIRQARKRARDNPAPDALLTETRTESGRITMGAALMHEYGQFLMARSDIFSGELRHLSITKDRVEAELFAEQPEILRKAAKQDPTMLPDRSRSEKHLTRMEMDVLAAEYASRQPGFSQAEEFTIRLAEELQRF